MSASRIIPLATIAAPSKGLDPAVSRLVSPQPEALSALFEPDRALLLLSRESEGAFLLHRRHLRHPSLLTENGPPGLIRTRDLFAVSVARGPLVTQIPILPGLPPVTFRTTDGPGALLLENCALLSRGIVAAASPRTRSRVHKHLSELVITTLLEALELEAGIAGRRRQRQQEIRDYVESRLHDPDLTPQAIAAAHGISTRALYLLFDGEEGAVSGWILDRRLERIHAELLDAANGSQRIAEIALRNGFRNAAHFSRRFRQKYGVSPRQVRKARLAG